jgi:hypothetical protein
MMKMLFVLIALTLAMVPYELQREYEAPLHAAVTDTPTIVDMAYADPATWGGGVPGLEADRVVRTSSADLACKGVFCVAR